MKRVRFAAAVIALAYGSAAQTFAAEGAAHRQVTVHGEGKAAAAPDQARVSIAVSEEGKTVEEVTQAVRRKTTAVLRALKGRAIADKDIQTQDYRVEPKTEWDGGKTRRVGYTAQDRIEVVLHDASKVGAALSAALDAGANAIESPRYEFADPRALERKALQAALEDARAKAELLAKGAGASLGPVLTVTEGASSLPQPPRPMTFQARAAVAGAAQEPEPIEAGEETVAADVTVVYELR